MLNTLKIIKWQQDSNWQLYKHGVNAISIIPRFPRLGMSAGQLIVQSPPTPEDNDSKQVICNFIAHYLTVNYIDKTTTKAVSFLKQLLR